MWQSVSQSWNYDGGKHFPRSLILGYELWEEKKVHLILFPARSLEIDCVQLTPSFGRRQGQKKGGLIRPVG
jgi:hypothetical protein